MTDKRLKSKLEPYYMEMLYLKSRGETYNDMLSYLDQRYSLKINYYTLYNFLRVREKRGILPAELSQSGVESRTVLNENLNHENESDEIKLQRLRNLINT
jgi:hypothetical protein